MNKKGMTLMEVLVSLILISIVMIFIINLLSDMKAEDVTSTKRNQDSLTRSSLINVIEGDLINKNLTGFKKSCDQKSYPNTQTCYQFIYSDVIKYLYVNKSFIAYGSSGNMEKWEITYGTYDINNIKVTYTAKVNGLDSPDYLLTIHVPVLGISDSNKRKYDIDLTIIGSTDGFTCTNCPTS